MRSSQNLSKYHSNRISLDNFNPYNSGLQIDSPRSKGACQRIGINPNDLYVPNEKVLAAQYLQEKQFAPNLTLDQFKNYAEIRRQKKVTMVQQMREQIARELKQEEMMRSTGHIHKSDEQNKRLEKENQNFQEREQIMINKIKNRQKKEIAQMLNSEFRIQAIKDKAWEKQQKMHKMEEMRERMFEQRRQEALIKKQEMADKLKYKEKLDKDKIKVLQHKAEVKEKTFQSSLREKELMRQGLIESNEGYRKQKKIKLQQQIQEFQKHKEIEFKKKKEELSKKDYQRQILIHSAYVHRKEVNEQKRQMYEVKLDQVRKFETQKVESSRYQFLQKEEANDKKQLELQKIKEIKIQQWQDDKVRRNQIVSQHQKEIEKQKLGKTLEYFQKMEKDTMLVQSQLLQSKKIYDSSLAPEIEKLMLKQNRPQSAQTMNFQSPKVQDQLRDRLTPQLDERAEYVRKMQLLNQQQRALKEEMKFLQVRETQKIVENKRRQKLLANISKIEAIKKKLDEREAEREAIIQKRNEMQRHLTFEKEALKDQFLKRSQKSNVNLQQLAEMYGVQVRPHSR